MLFIILIRKQIINDEKILQMRKEMRELAGKTSLLKTILYYKQLLWLARIDYKKIENLTKRLIWYSNALHNSVFEQILNEAEKEISEILKTKIDW